MSSMKHIEIIAFDADDTLWHNESLFTITQDKYKNLLAKYHDADWIESKLFDTETRNIEHFGYGVKGFTLSMIETAIELSEGRISGTEISQIIDFAKEMLKSPIELLDGVAETIEKLSKSHDLMVITKGDLFDQESKIARSGLANYFSKVEIVKEKDDAVYQKILTKHKIDKDKFVMVGNALKSDILPILRIGATAIHIPYHTTWAREIVAEDELKNYNFLQLKEMSGLADLFV
ncbi:MAG TPA: HAD family hydrolase [Pyrinomonadaceae bacterium]|nr:HAD family hydrolase [Pyrinomonadaceae bacterium]